VKFGDQKMRSLSYLQRVFIGLLVFGGNAAVWAQAPSLEWRTFKVPEYGTKVEYPATIFTADHLRVTLGRICANPT
jgi:hypothetical protein